MYIALYASMLNPERTYSFTFHISFTFHSMLKSQQRLRQNSYFFIPCVVGCLYMLAG